MANKPRIELPTAGYGNYYGQPQYGAGQYAVPKKKFPWIKAGIIGVLAVVLIAVVYFMFFSSPAAPVLLVSPNTLNIRASPGETTAVTVSVSNPGKKAIQTSLQASFPYWMSANRNIISLQPGETADIILTAAPPTGAESTTGMILFSGTESFVQINIEIVPAPSINFDFNKNSLSLGEGKRENILATISNTGQSDARSIVLSVKGIPEDWVEFDSQNFDIKTGQSVIKTISISVPKKTTPGVYYGVFTAEGQGFSKTATLALSVSENVGVLTVSPAELSGSQAMGSNIRLTITNTGNGELYNTTLRLSSGLANSIELKPALISLLEPKQSSEVILTIIGTNGTKNGNIEVTALDTHDNIQTRFITVSINVVG